MKRSNFVCHAILVGGLLSLAATARAALIESLPLNGTTTATVGTGGMTPNGTAYTTDHYGNANGAFEFTPGGTTLTTYVSVPGGGGLAGLSTGTIAFWAEWTGTQEAACCGGNISGVMVGRQDDGVYSNDLIGLSNPNPALGKVSVQLNGAFTNDVTGATPVGDGVWHLIALTFTSGSENLYIDGHLDGTGTSNVTVSSDTTTPLALGAWLGAGNSFASGAMSDFQVYDTVLTLAQIQALVVPEPSSWVALAGLGAMGLFVVARRRRNDAKLRATFGVRTLAVCLVCVVALFGGAIVSSAQASVFLGTPQPMDTRTDAYSYAGIGFVADNDATVNELGYWVASADSAGTGVTAAAHTVGLFQYAPTGTDSNRYLEIAQATFAAGSTATTPNGYAWSTVTSVTLIPTDTYAIEATQGVDTWGPYAGTDSFSSVNSEFGAPLLTGRFSNGSDTMPGVGNYADIANPAGNGGYAGPNIGVVPEPASLVALGGLCGMGLIGLAFRRRRPAASNRAAEAANQSAMARAGDSQLSSIAQNPRSSFLAGCFMKSMACALSAVIVCLTSTLCFAAAVIPSPANDVAPTGVGFESSEYDTFNGPDKLNDGDRDGNYYGPNSIAHTGYAADNYMGIHFTGVAPIDQINLFNRTDCCGTRIDSSGTNAFTVDIISGGTAAAHYLDGTIEFTQNYTFNPTISITAVGGDTASGMVINLPGVVVGDTVEVLLNHADYMALAEIEVFTTPEPSSLVAFAGLGVMGLIVIRRRRQAKA